MTFPFRAPNVRSCEVTASTAHEALTALASSLPTDARLRDLEVTHLNQRLRVTATYTITPDHPTHS